ncbi:Cell surface glycoprotein 1 [Porphyridium purpureum]|uniref:Cell surface glycoprotein 1 n=1 Tax=Porphyridium purpureum TaxID=35688 RepID=A0A5J4Z4H8_PORPP|nr:Cell surface glycoprotein 1 [Porphyridium purpureum]|eukprot:POR1565..scf295_1
MERMVAFRLTPLVSVGVLFFIYGFLDTVDGAGPVRSHSDGLSPGIGRAARPVALQRRPVARVSAASADRLAYKEEDWGRVLIERAYSATREGVPVLSPDCSTAHLGQCGIDFENPSSLPCAECYTTKEDVDMSTCFAACCPNLGMSGFSCFHEVAASSACASKADRQQLDILSSAFHGLREVCAASQCLTQVGHECRFDFFDHSSLLTCFRFCGSQPLCYEECCIASQGILDQVACAIDGAREQCGGLLKDPGDLELFLAPLIAFAGRNCFIPVASECESTVKDQCLDSHVHQVCNVYSESFDAEECCKTDVRAHFCLAQAAVNAAECGVGTGHVRLLVEKGFHKSEGECAALLQETGKDWRRLQFEICASKIEASCSVDISASSPWNNLCSCEGGNEETCEQECCRAIQNARECASVSLRFCTRAGVEGAVRSVGREALLAPTEFECEHCGVLCPSMPSESEPLSASQPEGEMFEEQSVVVMREPAAEDPGEQPSKERLAESAEQSFDTEQSRLSKQPLDTDSLELVFAELELDYSEQPVENRQAMEEPQEDSTEEPTEEPIDVSTATPTSEPTPTPTPTSEPTATTTPVPTVAVTATSSPTPAPVCIDAEWIEAHGLDKVHTGDGFGELLCIVGLEELPCGTPDHVLEVSAQSVARMRRGGLMLRTYGEVCSERACVRKLGRFNGVRHSDAHRMPEQEGHRVTTVSDRGTGWSAVENRVVVSALKMRWPRLTGALAYLQRTNSA